MNILSSTEWPSDMPDDRRVIAVLGMLQILEEGMVKDAQIEKLMFDYEVQVRDSESCKRHADY